jgi:hypothetical protein
MSNKTCNNFSGNFNEPVEVVPLEKVSHGKTGKNRTKEDAEVRRAVSKNN